MGSRRGLATLSKARRKAIASKGGQAVFKKGTGHLYDPLSAKAAGLKSAKLKKFKNAKLSAMSLVIHHNIPPVRLVPLNLSEDDFIYYASSPARVQELKTRIYGNDSQPVDQGTATDCNGPS